MPLDHAAPAWRRGSHYHASMTASGAVEAGNGIWYVHLHDQPGEVNRGRAGCAGVIRTPDGLGTEAALHHAE